MQNCILSFSETETSILAVKPKLCKFNLRSCNVQKLCNGKLPVSSISFEDRSFTKLIFKEEWEVLVDVLSEHIHFFLSLWLILILP